MTTHLTRQFLQRRTKLVVVAGIVGIVLFIFMYNRPMKTDVHPLLTPRKVYYNTSNMQNTPMKTNMHPLMTITPKKVYYNTNDMQNTPMKTDMHPLLTP